MLNSEDKCTAQLLLLAAVSNYRANVYSGATEEADVRPVDGSC